VTDKPLSDRQQAFVLAYVGPAKGVGVQAAKQAGYAGNEAVLDTQARRLLGNARIKLAIAEHRSQVVREGIATSEEVAVRLTAIGMGVATERRIIGGKDDFVEADVSMPGSTQVAALKTLNAMLGYEAAQRTEHSGTVGVVHLTAAQDEALSEWLLVRDDPRVQAVLRELRGE